MHGDTEETRKAQEAMAQTALRKEVELEVRKDRFDQQARRLMATCYPYAEAEYREDLVAELPETNAVPAVLEACAKFIDVDKGAEDVVKAEGPASSTSGGEQAREADGGEGSSVPWMSVIDEDMAEISELSKLPALQGLLEQMEAQAARVVRNELGALVADSGYGALDELGRERLRQICMDFREALHADAAVL